MKPETKMNKILNSTEWDKPLKILKLENLALCCVLASPIQKKVVEAYTRLRTEMGLNRVIQGTEC